MFACCDESGIDKKARWWVFGVAWLPHDEVAELEADCIRVRQASGCWGEFKWGNVTVKMLDAYSALLAAALSRGDLRYTSMVVDKKQLTEKEIQRSHTHTPPTDEELAPGGPGMAR